jgi:hypothetical protein
MNENHLTRLFAVWHKAFLTFQFSFIFSFRPWEALIHLILHIQQVITMVHMHNGKRRQQILLRWRSSLKLLPITSTWRNPILRFVLIGLSNIFVYFRSFWAPKLLHFFGLVSSPKRPRLTKLHFHVTIMKFATSVPHNAPKCFRR